MTDRSAGFAEAAGRAFHEAHQHAEATGLRVIEAEHLLLAIVSGADSDGGRMLAAAGLDRAGLEGALREERRRSLATAGVEPPSDEALRSTRRRAAIMVGASVKQALHRGRSAGPRLGRPRRSGDLLIGILSAELGTVPRALAIAGVDREALVARLEAAA